MKSTEKTVNGTETEGGICAVAVPASCCCCHNAKDCKNAEIERLRALVQCLLDNDPDDDAADGVTVLQVWRKDARRALAGEQEKMG